MRFGFFFGFNVRVGERNMKFFLFCRRSCFFFSLLIYRDVGGGGGRIFFFFLEGESLSFFFYIVWGIKGDNYFGGYSIILGKLGVVCFEY